METSSEGILLVESTGQRIEWPMEPGPDHYFFGKNLLSRWTRKYIVPELTNLEMIDKARRVLRPRKLAFENSAGDVACALLSTGGNLYLGVCIDISSGIGFCAEHSAIAAMLTAGESRIAKIVAVWSEGTVLPPCGRCRELMYQIDRENLKHTEVVLGPDVSVKLEELLPHPYGAMWSP